MKRLISLALAICFCLALLAGCGKNAQPSQIQQPTAPSTEAAQATLPQFTLQGAEALEGKKIIFIGNSYTFWGQTVIHKGYEVLTQDKRSNDPGYFFQLCQQKGIDVSVTNWTYGSHDVTDIMGEECNAERDCDGQIHKYFLKDAAFDYVVIQPYSEKDYKGNLVEHLKPTVEFFQQANPDTRFILLIPQMAHEKGYTWVKNVDQLKAIGFKICDWGGMLHDISQKKIQVPGATLTFSRSSFVNSKDNHHENLLAGYITTLMVYCAITGESAVGQPYDFCNNSELNALFDFAAFKEKNYPDNGVSNFIEIFESETDMAGLQQLVDQYLNN